MVERIQSYLPPPSLRVIPPASHPILLAFRSLHKVPLAPSTASTGSSSAATRPSSLSIRRSLAAPCLTPKGAAKLYLQACQLLDARNPETKARLYHRLIHAFARAPNGSPQVSKLFTRQLEEGVPILNETVQVVLDLMKATGQPLLPMIRDVLPRLPEDFDSHLLTTFIRAMIHEAGASAQEVEETIRACYALKGQREEEWPWVMWDLMVEAYGAKGDFRGAMGILKRFKATVGLQIALKAEQVDGTGASKIWAQDWRELASKPYISVLHLWATSKHRRSHRGSAIPNALANDLASMLGGVEKMPLGFLNAWMNAERMTGNLRRARDIWAIIESPPTPMLPRRRRSPDEHSWITYFKLLKTSCSTPTQLQEALTQLLSQRPAVPISARLVESILSAVAATGDLSLLMSVISLAEKKSAFSRRCVDIVCAALVRKWRTASLAKLFGTRKRAIAEGPIQAWEWDAVGKEMMHTLAREAFGKGLEDIRLPLGTPIAALVNAELPSGDTSQTMVVTRGFDITNRDDLALKLLPVVLRLVERVAQVERNLRGAQSNWAAEPIQ